MDTPQKLIQVFRDFGEINVVHILFIILVAWLILLVSQKLLPRIARKLPGKFRVHLLALVPAIRLLVMIGAAVLIFRRLVEPTMENLVVLFGFIGVGLGFALKDYAGSLLAGVVSLYENPYRPGDWITIDRVYGEVKSIMSRAVHLVTPDDTVAVIPHKKIWDTKILNATDRSTKLQCSIHFYIHPNHNGAKVRQRLKDVALTSPYIQLHTPVIVVAENTPWGIHYRVRAYPLDPQYQFTFITDIAERGRQTLDALGVEFVRADTVPEDAISQHSYR